MASQSITSPESAAAAPTAAEAAHPTDRIKFPTSTADKQLILSSLDDKLSSLKNEWKQKHGNNNTAREAFYFSAMDSAVNVLKAYIINSTEDVDEQTLEKQLFAYHHRYLMLDAEDDSSSEEEEDECEISFDDEEVLDVEAYEKVRELRAKSREVAGRVISIREEGLELALGVTERSLRELLKVHGFSDGEDEQMEEGAENVEAADNNRVAEPLNAALRNLTSSLQNVDSGLAQKLESIKETIGTIDSAVDKYQRVSQGDENALSQTEKALIAAAHAKDKKIEEEIVGEETMNDPDRNLAKMLAGL